jgi:peptidoglycan/xylan/chitin deacetylase (PgdA/CDA1 family)
MLTRVSPVVLRAFLLLTTCAIGAAGLGACSAEPAPAPREGRTATASFDLQAADIVGTTLPAKTLALTFDDGPGPRAAELSMYLKAQDIRAVFFVNGARIAATTLPNTNTIAITPGAAGMLAQMVADGHLVSNHTTTHRDMVTEVLPTGTAKLLQELTETDTDISAYVPSGRWLFRAPYGSYSTPVYNGLKGTAMDKYVGPIYWDVGGNSDRYPNSAADWACWQGQLKTTGGAKANGTGYATTVQCGDAYMNEINAVGRGIVLMHDPYAYASGNTVDMVKYLVPKLKAAGYAFVRADQVPAITALLPPCDPTCATCLGITAAQCATCASGRWFNAGSCTLCGVCSAGKYASAACTSTADITCAACDATCAACTGPSATQCSGCAAGAFLQGGACKACSKCAPGTFESTPCTATKDGACAPCDASCGACAGPAPSQCTACGGGKFLSAGACRPCTICPANTREVSACGADRDTVCAPCDPGTTSAAGATACVPGGGASGSSGGSSGGSGGAGSDGGAQPSDPSQESGCGIAPGRRGGGLDLLAGLGILALVARAGSRRFRPNGNVQRNPP